MNVAILTVALCVDAPGLKTKIDALSQLKVKGLVVGPIHKAPKNNVNELDLNSVAVAGTLTQFKTLLDAAHKKSECLSCLSVCYVNLLRPTSIISKHSSCGHDGGGLGASTIMSIELSWFQGPIGYRFHVSEASKLSSPCHVRFLFFIFFPNGLCVSTGINVVLDLTPNYEGEQSWFDDMSTVTDKMKVCFNSV